MMMMLLIAIKNYEQIMHVKLMYVLRTKNKTFIKITEQDLNKARARSDHPATAVAEIVRTSPTCVRFYTTFVMIVCER